MTRTTSLVLIAGAVSASLLAPSTARGQAFRLTKDQMVQLTAKNPFERFDDGRPKIPDNLIERAKGLSAEEVLPVMNQQTRYTNQYEDGFQILHPGKTMAGRAFTVQFMPARPDLDLFSSTRAKEFGINRLYNQAALDMLQPGDVLVVDLFGKKDGGTIVGDNLFYYVMKATKGGGMVVDGSIRDLQGIAEMDMPAYFRTVHPTAIGGVTITGINIPVRIGNATVLPGDLVFGDREGVYFVPPELVQRMLDQADTTHIHDEWTRKKFDEGKYKSGEIYGSPSDPKLKEEYADYLKRRLAEINAARK